MLCKYKDILGIPGKGIHTHVAGIALADVIMTIVLAFFISRITKASLVYTTILLFLLGIFLHRLFCVRTVLDKVLF